MTDARNFAERLFAVMDGQRWNDFETVMHRDIQMSSPFADLHSAAEWVEFTRGFATAAPDCKHTITHVIQDGERFAVQGHWTGTHTGPLATPMGEVPATGRTITLPFCTVGTLRDGRLAAAHVYLDQLSMLAQLGLAPQPEPTTSG
jgi:predicted ester cyclase